MKFSVVIVTYNRMALLKECLECVDHQLLKFDNIIIINNCSTDGTTEFLGDFCENRRDILLINTEMNLGGSGGFELGVKNVSSDTDYVLLIDDDAMLDAAFLKEIHSHMEDKTFAYSGTIRTEGVIDTTHRRRIKNRIMMTKSDVPVMEYEKDCFYYDLSTFCGLMVSKKVIDEIGFPKGEYFIWYDDTEYSLRIIKYSKIKNVNSAGIDHKTVISGDNSLSWKSYYGYRNQIDVGKRYSSFPAIYKLFRYSYHYYRIIYFNRLARKNPDDCYYKACSELHRAVIRDSRRGVMGISKEYYPGRNLRVKGEAE